MKKRPSKNIFLSSIHQNAGKTTISLGLYQAFKKGKLKVSFLKPVGQQVVNVGKFQIDKDSYLISKVFRLSKNLKDMSPITIKRGYTEKYIFNPHRMKVKNSIEKAYKHISKNKDAVIIEGTGHAGVGSVIDFSNADVAALLDSKVIIISEGGIGKCIDEIILNKALFDVCGVEVLGVIVNKVIPAKYEKIKRVLKQGLENKGIKLLGVIPTDPLLSSPTVDQIKKMLDLSVISGRRSTYRRVKHTIIAAMEPHNMIHYLKENTLVVTSGDRVDNILLAVSSHLVREERNISVSGIILTGGLRPNPRIIKLLENSKIPVLITQEDTYTIAAKIEGLVVKIQRTDKDKIKEAAVLVNKYVDVDKILRKI